MNAVGIDVSKGKSTIAILRPFGEVIASPFEVCHTASDLDKLVKLIKKLKGETKILMEQTSKYHQPIARFLNQAGLFVTVINPILSHNYGKQTSIRRVKTDTQDAVKLASMALDRWLSLKRYVPEDDIRSALKSLCRQYNHITKLKIVLKNNLISLLDQTFPGINSFMYSSVKKADGHEKWIDFVSEFWHCECVSGLSLKTFKHRLQRWCTKFSYHCGDNRAETIHAYSLNQYPTLPKEKSSELLIMQAVRQLNMVIESLSAYLNQMRELCALLPEHDLVMAMHGVGGTLGPQLIAELGDVRRFYDKRALVAFAGIDAPPYQSGKFESRNRNISKRGSPSLRKTLFMVMTVILQRSHQHEPVFQFIDKKRAEGKHFYVYMVAGINKFLRIYYAKVKEYLNSIEKPT